MSSSSPKDPQIKLFGTTILSPEISDFTSPSSVSPRLPPPDDRSDGSDDCITEDDDKSTDSDKASLGNTVSDAKKEGRSGTDSKGNLLIDTNLKTPSAENEAAKASKTEEEQSESSNSQDKTLKKPDKIIPCPRCNSMETKFCYYNNYNVNQPRHFCKKCQRYWTAGGTMRNVPVGAGRRKNKNSISQYRQISVPNPVNVNGTVLAFGSDAPNSPLCENMTSVLKIAEKTTEEPIKGEDQTSQSSSKDDANLQTYPPQVQFLPPWPYPWNPTQWGPAFCPPPGFAMPFYPPPPPYWGCTVPVQWIPPPPENPGPTPETLGKHSRTGEEEKSLWVPKTLRIDDPGEAAKSSIWATLGIQDDDKDESFSRGGSLFKAFGSKADEKNHNTDTCQALQANPAALSRSQNFQESS